MESLSQVKNKNKKRMRVAHTSQTHQAQGDEAEKRPQEEISFGLNIYQPTLLPFPFTRPHSPPSLPPFPRTYALLCLWYSAVKARHSGDMVLGSLSVCLKIRREGRRERGREKWRVSGTTEQKRTVIHVLEDLFSFVFLPLSFRPSILPDTSPAS